MTNENRDAEAVKRPMYESQWMNRSITFFIPEVKWGIGMAGR